MHTSIFALFALVASTLAHPAPDAMPGLDQRAAKPKQNPKCKYMTAQYLSTCHEGSKLHCNGNINACNPRDGYDTQDAFTTAENESVCVGKKQPDWCVQSIACCPQ